MTINDFGQTHPNFEQQRGDYPVQGISGVYSKTENVEKKDVGKIETVGI